MDGAFRLSQIANNLDLCAKEGMMTIANLRRLRIMSSTTIPCATVGPPTCWKRAPTCGPFRFYLVTETWKPPLSTCTCRNGICKRSPIRWTVLFCPAPRASVEVLDEKIKNDSAHPRGGRHSTRAGRSLPGSVSIEL